MQETKPERETFKSINTEPALLKHSSHWQSEPECIAANKTRIEKRKRPFGNAMGHHDHRGINDLPGHRRKKQNNKEQVATPKSWLVPSEHIGSVSSSASPDLPERSNTGKGNQSFVVHILRANFSLERGNVCDNQKNHKNTIEEFSNLATSL